MKWFLKRLWPLLKPLIIELLLEILTNEDHDQAATLRAIKLLST
jgi:hypothetical protein